MTSVTDMLDLAWHGMVCRLVVRVPAFTRLVQMTGWSRGEISEKYLTSANALKITTLSMSVGATTRPTLHCFYFFTEMYTR